MATLRGDALLGLDERGTGVLPLEEGGRVDFHRLRAQRLERCRTEMARDDLDALLLGNEANARYASGARRLWLGGSRPYVPGCIVLPDGQPYVMSTWDDGIPPDIPRTNLFGASWNPENHVKVLASIEGLRAARRVGVDGMTPLMASLISSALPDAELVDAGPTMIRARQVKTPDELACIRAAIAVTESSLGWALDALRPGITERALFGHFTERLGALGLTLSATQCTFVVLSGDGSQRRMPRRTGTNHCVNPGDLVALDAGALYAGYEGSVARTFSCPGGTDNARAAERRLYDRARAVHEALVAACRPGVTAQDVVHVYEASGEPVPELPVVFGVGLGMEPPLAGAHLPSDAGGTTTLVPGMVLALQTYVHEEGTGGYLQRDVVLVGQEGSTLLTSHSRGGDDANR